MHTRLPQYKMKNKLNESVATLNAPDIVWNHNCFTKKDEIS